MNTARKDSRSYGSMGTNEGDTQAGTFGSPGGTAGGMSHRVENRKNLNNVGPSGRGDSILGPESGNFGLPTYDSGMRHTGKRG